jgi:hypothetical protein
LLQTYGNGQLITEEAKAPGFFKSQEFNDYKTRSALDTFHLINNTGGGQNDCLILSFLGCISKSFRNAEQPLRHKVASDLRRIILPSLPLFKTKFYDEYSEGTRLATYRNYTELMKGTTFLDDTIIDFLARQYKVTILYFEGIKVGYMVGHMGRELQIMPPAVNIAEPPGTTAAIIIYNINNGHFESVYTITEKGGMKIVFTPPEVKAIRSTALEGFPFKTQGAGHDAVRIEDGTTVYVKGEGDKKYMVVGAHYQEGTDQKVDFYYVTDNLEGYQAIVAGNPGIRLDPTKLGINVKTEYLRDISRIPIIETRGSAAGGASSASSPVPGQCPACTYKNPEGAAQCEVCGAKLRDGASPDGGGGEGGAEGEGKDPIIIQGTINQYTPFKDGVPTPVEQGGVRADPSSCTVNSIIAARLLPLINILRRPTPEILDFVVKTGLSIFSSKKLTGHQGVPDIFEIEDLKLTKLFKRFDNPDFGLLLEENPAGAAVEFDTSEHDWFTRFVENIRSTLVSRRGRPDTYTAVVITRTPETVCLFVPPNKEGWYMLFDSHPRPGIDNAHIRISSFDAMKEYLETELFPIAIVDGTPDLANKMGQGYLLKSTPFLEMQNLADSTSEELTHLPDPWGDGAHRIRSFVDEIDPPNPTHPQTLKQINDAISALPPIAEGETEDTTHAEIRHGLNEAKRLVDAYNLEVESADQAAGSRRRSAKRKGARKTHKSRKSRR